MIKGKKVSFRAVEERDLEEILKWVNDPDISDLVVGWSFPLSMAKQKEWFQKSLNDSNTRRFIVESYDEGVIGLTGLWDINWHNRNAMHAIKLGNEQFRGKGYGTDIILTMMSYAFFDVGLNRLWSDILPYNISSYRAWIEKCGWKVEGRLRQQVFRNGKFYDLLRVGVLKEDFLNHPRFEEYAPSSFLERKEQQVEIKGEHRVDF